jgi:agmatinase
LRGRKLVQHLPWGGALSGEGGPGIVILGVPYDAGSTNRKGAALAPEAIRKASSSQSLNPCTEEGHNLKEIINIHDKGDLVLQDDPEKMAADVREAVAGILASGAIPILLGGDHSVTPPAVMEVAKSRGKIDILYIDAHPDLYESYEGSPHTHASTALRIAREVDFERFVQVGIRMPAAGQLEKAQELDIRVITAYHLVAPEDLRFENPLYLSVDMDCLDPAFAPGVGNPVPGGLSTRELLDILKSVSGKIAAADVVEFVPAYDVSEITATAAARLVIEIAGLIAGVR